jgi:hypothetical protein
LRQGNIATNELTRRLIGLSRPSQFDRTRVCTVITQLDSIGLVCLKIHVPVTDGL